MARDTIKQRIALEGADAIRDAFKALGEAGRKAFKEIQDAAEKAGAGPQLERLVTTLAIVRERFEALRQVGQRVQVNFAQFSRRIGTLSNDFATVTRRVTLFAAAIAGATAGFVGLVKAGAEAADVTAKQAEALGLSIEAYQKLKYSADQANLSTEAFEPAVRRLSALLGRVAAEGEDAAQSLTKTKDLFADTGVVVVRGAKALDETSDATITAASAFRQLGVEIEDAKGKTRDTESVLLDLADAFQAMPAGSREAALANAIFGKSWADILPFLNQGAAAIRADGVELTRLRKLADANSAALGDAFSDAFGRAGVAAAGLRDQIGEIFSPALTQATDAFTELLVENREAITAFAESIAAEAVPLVKDLFNTLAGNDAAVENKGLITLRDQVVAFGGAVAEVVNGVVIPAFNLLLGVFDTIADGLNAVFGTNIDGGALLAVTAVLQLVGAFGLLGNIIGVITSGLNLVYAALLTLGAGLSLASGLFSGLVSAVALFGGVLGAIIASPAALAAAFVAAGVAIFVFWDDIQAAALDAWQFVADLWSGSGLADLFSGLAEAGANAFEGFTARSEQVTADARAQGAAIAEALGSAWTTASAEAEAAVAENQAALADIGSGAAAAWDGLSKGAADAWQSVLDAFGGQGSGAVGEGQFDAIAQGAADAFAAVTDSAGLTWQAVVDGAMALPDQIGTAWNTVASVIEGVWGGITSSAQFVIDGLGSIFSAGAQTIAAIWQGISDTVTGIWTGTSDAIVQAAVAITDAITTASETAGDVEGAAAIAEGLVAPFIEAKAQIEDIWTAINGLTEVGIDGVLSAAQNTVDGIGTIAAAATSKLRSELDAMLSALTAGVNRIIAQIERAIARIKAAKAAAADSGGSSKSGKGLAFGGPVRGAGTATSDSIPIWASNGEFMMQARAVRKYGVQFMRLINGGRLSLASLRDGVQGLATGGLVGGGGGAGLLDGLAALLGGGMSLPVPALAGGADTLRDAPALRPINVTLPGGETVQMMGGADAASQLMRFRAKERKSAAGRKPRWYDR